MRISLGLVALLALPLLVSPADAARWSALETARLPDAAFAVIERTPDGQAVRRLPHHDAAGGLDIPHLCSALGRRHQVQWRDPANAEVARQHLDEHVRQIGASACRPKRP